VRAELAATWPDNALLPAIRQALAGAQDALLCVAFVNRRGINLLEPQLTGLGARCRLLVTSAFGGDTTGSALARAAELQVQVRVLNPLGGTYHPKLYLTRAPRSTVAVVGSANLTSGLVGNIETALVVSGRPDDRPIADCWELGESLWERPDAVDWVAVPASLPDERFDPALLHLLQQAIRPGAVVPTVSQGRPNRVVEITPHGVYIETARSRQLGTPPPLVPAWMVQLAWDYLQLHGRLTNRYLLATDGLNVKRSSAVCTLLSRLPGVEVSTRPVELRLRRRPGSGRRPAGTAP
jgi:HKD family nuclease